jgi:hypothetical protein
MGLAFLLAVPDAVRCCPVQAPGASKLNLIIVEGEGAINNVRQRTAREPIIQVTDENNRPIAGAAVVFTLPESGPGGTFADGSRTLQVLTDGKGRAMARGLRLNDVPGKFEIQVDASYQGATASTTIHQSNALMSAAAGGGLSGKAIAILAAIGAAVAVGVIIAVTRGDETPPPNQPPGGNNRQ